MKQTILILFLTCLAAAPAVQAQTAAVAAAPASYSNLELRDPGGEASTMRPLIERFVLDVGALSRKHPIEISATRRTRLKAFYDEWVRQVAGLNFEAMKQDDRVDYILFKNHLNYRLRRLELDSKELLTAAPLLPFAQAIIDLDETLRRMEPVQSAKAAVTLNAVAKQIENARRAVDPKARGGAGESVTKSTALRAAAAVGDLRSTLKHWFDFYNLYDPDFTWRMAEPYKAVDSGLQAYQTALRGLGGARREGERADAATPGPGPGPGSGPGPTGQERGGGRRDETLNRGVAGVPIGREALMSELAYEMIPYTPEELIALANKEFAWCENEMKRASREMGFGDDWMKALEKVKTLHVEPGKQPQLIRDLALEAEAYLDQHDLITVPPLARETWRMEMMSPQRQLVNPFFTGGEVISVSFPTSTMTEEQKLMSMRGNNIHFARATVFHELIPGHHLQGFMHQRYRPYRSVFNTPFSGEGWALYWELLLWDMGFGKTPENRVGMLFWRMHRCARIIFSLSYHLEKMTAQECVDFLVKRVGHEPDNAAGEVRRSFEGNYTPLYQAAYLLGGLQIYSLRKELVGPGKMTNRQFHDTILKLNRIQIEMVRASLTGQKLAPDFVSSWKFYGPVKPE